MANALPWSVRGIDPDIREQAVEAAHRSGMSIGRWLNHILAGNLDDEEFDDEPTPIGRARRTSRRKPRRMDELSERLERLGQQRTMTATSRFSDQDNGNSPVLDLIESAVLAIERLETRASVTQGPAQAPGGTENIVETLRSFERKLDALAGLRAAQAASSFGARAPGMPIPEMPGLGGFPDADPAFSRALAEIEARRRNLDADVGGGASPISAPIPSPSSASAHIPDAGTNNPHIDAMREQLELLVSRIDTMRTEPRVESSAMQDRLDELASRIREWGAPPQDNISALRSELTTIAASIEKLSPHRLVDMVESAVSTMADKASRDGLPDRLTEPLERMHEDVRAVLREVVSSQGSDRLTQEVGNIARRLDLLAQGTNPARLDDIARETEAIKSLVGQAMRTQPLDGLAQQIEVLARQIEKFQHGSTPGNDRQVLDAIADIGDRLERIDPAATFSGIETRLAAISGIEDKLTDIARGMKKLAKDSQPLPQLDTIAERLERIDRVLESTKGKPLAGLDTIATRLEKIGSSLDRAENAPAKDGQSTLVGMLERLSERMDQVHSASAESPALDALQEEIARLTRSMEQSGGTPAGLVGIERSVGDLFTQIDQARRDMRDVAETAATKAAQEAIRQAPRDESSDTLAAEGLLLIKRDLNEFKTAQSDAERRTRSTLEALHGTLETLVSRLGDIETREAFTPTATSRPAGKPDMPSAPAFTAQRDKPEPPASASPKEAVSISTSSPSPAASKPAATSDDTLADLPLEPGMQPGMEPQSPPEDPVSADPRTNFIAAARRAAQNAVDRSQVALAEEKASKSGKPSRAEAGQGGPAPFLIRARKPILLGLAALVFSFGALKVLTSRNQSDAPIPPMPERPPVSAPRSQPTAPDVGEKRSDAPATTGSLGAPVAGADNQPMPAMPGSGEAASAQIGHLSLDPLSGKRAQRLSETNAISQTDPLTVGSIGPDGNARPIETGRAAITRLLIGTNLKAQDKLREAALGGSPAAMFEIGSRYADGRGVTRDPKVASNWFEQAAAAGHGPSQYRLGSLYREGAGQPKDPSLAFQWFDRAAAQGHVLAMHNAAVLLAEGVHGAPDYAGAALWFKRAAEHGVKDSQFNVAILFARGLGVNQDLGESYRWFAVAALQGDKDAAKKRDDIAARLTKEQLAKEVARVKSFRPNLPNPVANEPGSWDKSAKQGA